MTEIKTAVSKYCEGEKCRCGKPATQKIEQVIFDDMPPSHGYTQYVCQHHFDEVMRPYLSQSLPVQNKDFVSFKIEYRDHTHIVLTNTRGDTFTSKSEELADFLLLRTNENLSSINKNRDCIRYFKVKKESGKFE